MKIFRKIGSAFKWLGKKTLWLIRKDETLFAIKLATKLVPIPALELIAMLVLAVDEEDRPGAEKMAIALEGLPAILEEFGIELEDESDARLLIELALAIMKGRARVINT
jgi:hypothetical protein